MESEKIKLSKKKKSGETQILSDGFTHVELHLRVIFLIATLLKE